MKRIFQERYDMICNFDDKNLCICIEFYDKKKDIVLSEAKILKLLNDLNDMKIAYSCDLNATKHYKIWKKERLWKQLNDVNRFTKI